MEGQKGTEMIKRIPFMKVPDYVLGSEPPPKTWGALMNFEKEEEQPLITFACVRWDFIGWHNWPAAKDGREYLKDRHRHKFFCEVQIEVYHNDREIEYHDLLDYCRVLPLAGELHDFSCEMICEYILERLNKKYGRRKATVSVWEDNEVGAKACQL